jgi:hypothetical protein
MRSSSPTAASNGSASGAASAGAVPVDGSERLSRDLAVVMEKVQLCREMLQVSPGIHEDETLAGVIGFLEACSDRLVFY